MLWLLLTSIFVFLLFFCIVFWIWMLIDCLNRKKFEDKLIWVLALIFLSCLGAILYYLLVKRNIKRRK
ncbi:MAG: PLDc N-terminal domain-containing protein [Candidatus Aenigmarchaeota archaeon]|nr:PLDc N-terminal domain-containing protein [Candidatus Aenigmarchaeota archaeon]